MAVIMIKISKILISLFLTIVLLAETATAQMVELKKEKNRVKEELKVAAFLDYPPFGNYANPPYRDSFSSIFQPIVEDYAAKQNFEVTYVITKTIRRWFATCAAAKSTCCSACITKRRCTWVWNMFSGGDQQSDCRHHAAGTHS